MKLIDNKIYITFNEMVDCGVSANYLRKAKSTGTKCWSFLDDPADKRKVLVEYEALKDEYKSKVIARFGNPYEQMAKQPIKDLIKWDDKAEEFYLAYRYNGTDGQPKPLPIEHVKKYTAAANFLNMLKRVLDDKKALKELLHMNIQEFWNNCLEIIETEKVDLPTSYLRLYAHEQSAYKCYINEGYQSLISKKFGNTSAAKVKDEVSKASLEKLLANPLQFDDVIIAHQYNRWAKENGYKTITDATVGNYRAEWEENIIQERQGKSALKERVLPDIYGEKVSAPLMLVENDDNHLDFLYQDPENPKEEHRYLAMAVADSFNGLMLGMAWMHMKSMKKGDSIRLVRAAYLQAMYYIRSLTGAWYLPDEVKADRWAKKSLYPFYNSIGKFIEPGLGNKHRGYIEPLFGNVHWKRCQKLSSPDAGTLPNNWSGNNVTAKNRGVNMEWLNSNKKDWPTIGQEADAQIAQFLHRLRHMPVLTKKRGLEQSKEQQWLEAWNAMPIEKRPKPITDEQFLLKFGIEHNPGEWRSNKIGKGAVEATIGGQEYIFKINDWRPHVGKPVQIIYDPYDMSRALITDKQQVRMIGTEMRLTPRAQADHRLDSRTFMHAAWQEKRDLVEDISQKRNKRELVLANNGFDAEAVLQSGTMTKELKMMAEQRVLSQSLRQSSNIDEDYLDQM